MQQVARETWVAFERRLERAQVPAAQRPDYHKWTRFYLDFCHKYRHPPRSLTSLGPFLSKLAAKNRSVEQRHQAAHAIKLLLGRPAELGASPPAQTAEGPASTAPTPRGQSQVAPRPVTPPPRPMPPAQAGPPPPPSSTGLAASPAGPTKRHGPNGLCRGFGEADQPLANAPRARSPARFRLDELPLSGKAGPAAGEM
jgi:hypothetical protein